MKYVTITQSGIFAVKPLRVYKVILTTKAGGTGIASIYKGVKETGEQLISVRANMNETKEINFQDGYLVNGVVYVDLNDFVDSLIVGFEYEQQ